MVGASRSFIHRISELSSLEGETVRQEKLRKMKKPRKPPSWQSPSSQSPFLRIKTSESVPTWTEQSKTFLAPCSFQQLALTACLSSVILVSCLTWLIFTFWDSWPELPSCGHMLDLLWQISACGTTHPVNEDYSVFSILTPDSLEFSSHFYFSLCNGLQWLLGYAATFKSLEQHDVTYAVQFGSHYNLVSNLLLSINET